MKRSMNFLRQAVAIGCVLSISGAGAIAFGQDAAQNTTPAQPAAQVLTADQLDNLVAPIALYPDSLLSQVMVAATYPLEVVEAQQWYQQNRSLTGTALMDAARQQNWDPSVQALVAFPDVLTKLTQDVRWTTDLGNAFLAQQADVMSAVQRMRARAQANGRLNTTAQQTVKTEAQNGQTAIEIQPADPQVIYVPTYNPEYVWGPPVWGVYPPLFYPGFGFGFGFGPAIYIGGFFGGWGGWGFGGWGWGWGPNWFGHGIFVNNYFFGRYGFRGGYGGFRGTSAWAHNPNHRLGVAYPNRSLAGRFQAASAASRVSRANGFSGARNSFNQRGTMNQSAANRTAGQAGSRNLSQSNANRSSGQSSANRNSGQSSANRYSGQSSANRYSGQSSANRYSGQTNANRYSGQNSRSAAPQSSARSYQSAPRSYSAPSQHYSGGGGGGHSFSGGSGHSSGGGSHSSGGGGGRRR